MAKPLTVSFSHELGKAEVVRRINDGIAYLKANYASFITIDAATWEGDHLDFQVTTLKQNARGGIDVEDNRVTIMVTLPLLLAVMADKARALIEKEGTLLLTKK